MAIVRYSMAVDASQADVTVDAGVGSPSKDVSIGWDDATVTKEIDLLTHLTILKNKFLQRGRTILLQQYNMQFGTDIDGVVSVSNTATQPATSIAIEMLDGVHVTESGVVNTIDKLMRHILTLKLFAG